MVFGYFPFDSTLDFFTFTLDKLDLDCDLKDLLSKIFDVDPCSRCTITDVLIHPWLYDVAILST